MRFFNIGDGPGLVDSGWASIVSGKGEFDVALVAVKEFFKVSGPGFDILFGVKGVIHVKLFGGRGHKLHQAFGTLGGDGARALGGFLFDHAAEQLGLHVIDLRGAIDEWGQLDFREGIALGGIDRWAAPLGGEFDLFAHGLALNGGSGTLLFHGGLEGLGRLVRREEE